MAEIIYEYPEKLCAEADFSDIRWLAADEYDLFAEHLQLCGQKVLSRDLWEKIYEEKTQYCLLFVDEKPVARACVEKYSELCWEVADVRVVPKYRNRGCARRVCKFVLKYILMHRKTATIRTEESNTAMQKVIARLGFIARGE